MHQPPPPPGARRALTLAAGVLLAGTLTACSTGGSEDTPSATAGSDVTTVTAGTLTVCSNPPFEPFEFMDADGTVVGFDIDITAEVAKDLGLTQTVREQSFESLESGAALDSGTCDIVATGMTITPVRQEKIDFSTPYFDAGLGLLVKDASITTLEDLAGKKVAVQQATTGDRFCQDKGLDCVQYEDLGLQAQAVTAGQADAAINDYAVLAKFQDEGLKLTARFDTDEQYGLGVKKGNTALLTAVNATLERIRSDGTYDKIFADRIGEVPSAS